LVLIIALIILDRVFIYAIYAYDSSNCVSPAQHSIFFLGVLSPISKSLSQKNGSVKRHKSQKKHSTKDTKKSVLTRKTPHARVKQRERERTKTDRRQRQKRRGGETVWTRRRFRRAQTRAFLFFCSQNRELKKHIFISVASKSKQKRARAKSPKEEEIKRTDGG